MIHFPIRHKFCCVNLIGRNWRTWKLNRLTPICLLCAKMYLVALGVWSGFGKPWDSDYYISHSKSMDILDLLQSVLKQRYSKTHCGHRGPSSTGSRKASSCAVNTTAEKQIVQPHRRWHALSMTTLSSWNSDMQWSLQSWSTFIHNFLTHVNEWSSVIDQSASCHHVIILDAQSLQSVLLRFLERGKLCEFPDNMQQLA